MFEGMYQLLNEILGEGNSILLERVLLDKTEPWIPFLHEKQKQFVLYILHAKKEKCHTTHTKYYVHTGKFND